ncbi:MAG: V-type ATP synthase subunit I [Thermoplasmata archaeon]
MVLRPVKLVKISVISLNDYKGRIIDYFHEKGVIQIENAGPEILSYFSQGSIPDNYREISEQLVRFKGMEKYLIPKKTNKKFKFENYDELKKVINSISIDVKLNEIRDRLEKLKTIKKGIENDLESLRILKNLKIDAINLNSKSIFFIIGRAEVENRDQFLKEISSQRDFNFNIHTNHHLDFIVIGPKPLEPKALEIVNKFKPVIYQLTRFNDSTDNLIKNLESELKNFENEEINLKNELDKISEEYYALISAISEELEIYLKKMEINVKFGMGEKTFALTGWVPEREIEKIGNDLDKITNRMFIFSVLKTHEEPPTLLENPKPIKFFEFFINFYSLPNSLEFDPTLIFSIVFPIFFGFMLGDVGYGFVILLFSIWLLRRVTKPPKKSKLPKIISSFGRTMMSNWSWGRLARALIWGSTIGIVFGILFNEYFGMSLPYRPILDPIHEVSKLLLITAWIGVIYVTYGLILGAINHYTMYKYYGDQGKNHLKEMYGRIGWIFIAWGFTLLGLWLLKWPPVNIILGVYISIPFLALGVALLLIGEGIFSIMEMASIISHILSFTRIMGVLLASVILAFVLDNIFIKALHYGVPTHIIIAFLVLIIGHGTNILIAIFEPGIQGARLHYVEFFSKFFHGNGKPFQPFTSQRKYTEK